MRRRREGRGPAYEGRTGLRRRRGCEAGAGRPGDQEDPGQAAPEGPAVSPAGPRGYRRTGHARTWVARGRGGGARPRPCLRRVLGPAQVRRRLASLTSGSHPTPGSAPEPRAGPASRRPGRPAARALARRAPRPPSGPPPPARRDPSPTSGPAHTARPRPGPAPRAQDMPGLPAFPQFASVRLRFLAVGGSGTLVSVWVAFFLPKFGLSLRATGVWSPWDSPALSGPPPTPPLPALGGGAGRVPAAPPPTALPSWWDLL